MSKDSRDQWSSPVSGDPAVDQKSLRSMISDAVSQSKGRGAVQGTTIFFKNLAESIAHSNRNLKIGLGFLTAAFLVISLLLGFMLYKSFEQIGKTKGTFEDAVGKMDAGVRKQVEPLVEEMKRVQKQLDSHKLDTQASMDQSRMMTQQEIDALRQENQRLAQSLDQLTKQIDKYMQAYNQKLVELNGRVQALEKSGAR